MLIASGRHAAATCPECASKLKTKLNIFSFSENKTFCATCREKGCGAPVWEIRGIKDKYRNDIAKTNNVKCGCKSPDVTMGIEEDRVVLCCKNCGRKKVILSTEENIDYLLKAGTIVLDNTILNS